MRNFTLSAGIVALAAFAPAQAQQSALADGAPVLSQNLGAPATGGYQALGTLVRTVNVGVANGVSHGGLAAGTIVAVRGVERAADGTGKSWWYCAANTPTARIDKWDPITATWVSQFLHTQSGGGFAGRCGATDGNGKLWFGEDAGRVFEFDINPTTGDLTYCKRYIITTNGTTNIGVVRQLARDPSGTFYTGSFGGPIYTFTLPTSTCDGAVAPGVNITVYCTAKINSLGCTPVDRLHGNVQRHLGLGLHGHRLERDQQQAGPPDLHQRRSGGGALLGRPALHRHAGASLDPAELGRQSSAERLLGRVRDRRQRLRGGIPRRHAAAVPGGARHPGQQPVLGP
jgi:hypothetical protein